MADDDPNKPTEKEAAPRELQAGQSVGLSRYVLKKFLGQGGMGIVWLAHDGKLGDEVALKFLPGQLRLDSAALDDLRQETLKSRKLTHLNIIRIHDLFEVEGEDPFISMEYVDGPTLSKRRVQMPARIMAWEDLADLTRQLCEALEYAHNEKVIHRDLKPTNLMVDSRQHIKLADFGIARVLTDSFSRITMRQGTSGTLVYMSPQQLDGSPSNPTDDFYSVGATLYELMTSKPPFYTGEIAHQIRYVEAVSMTQRLEELRIASRVPKAVEDAVAACLNKNPSDRPQNARELGESLGVMESRPPSSKSGHRGAKPLPAPPPRTNKRLVGIGFGILAGLAVAVGAAFYFRPPPPKVPAAGSLQVTIIPSEAVAAGAKWQVDNGTPQANGAFVPNLAPGPHTLAFTTVSDWTTPSNQTISVGSNATNVTTGIYVQASGSLEVTISPPAAVAAGAQWRVDAGSLHASGENAPNLSPGEHTVAFQAAPGWTAPSNQSVTISAGKPMLLQGAYQVVNAIIVVPPPMAVPPTGSLEVTIAPSEAVAAGAKWQVDAGSFHASGETLPNLSLGEHIVGFQSAPGWNAPADQSVTISAGKPKLLQGAYQVVNANNVVPPPIVVPHTGSLEVTITPNEAVAAGAKWQVDGGQFLASGAIVSNLPPGTHNIGFLTGLEGWMSPSNQTAMISADLRTPITGTYLSLQIPKPDPFAAKQATATNLPQVISNAPPANATAFALAKQGSNYIHSQAMNSIIEIKSPKGPVPPSDWDILYADPIEYGVVRTGVKVSFRGGVYVTTSQVIISGPLGVGGRKPMPAGLLNVDSDRAWEIAKAILPMQDISLTSTEFFLCWEERPVWKMKFWVPNPRNPKNEVELGEITISADDGRLIKNSVRIK